MFRTLYWLLSNIFFNFRKLLKQLNDEEDEFGGENKDAGEAFDKLDVDGSGSISFDELIDAFKNGKF